MSTLLSAYLTMFYSGRNVSDKVRLAYLYMYFNELCYIQFTLYTMVKVMLMHRLKLNNNKDQKLTPPVSKLIHNLCLLKKSRCDWSYQTRPGLSLFLCWSRKHSEALNIWVKNQIIIFCIIHCRYCHLGFYLHNKFRTNRTDLFIETVQMWHCN